MALLMGVDLGTSGVKAVVLDEDGTLLMAARRAYPCDAREGGWVEQDPEAWWQAALAAMAEAVSSCGHPASAFRGIGLSGQMHGCVLLDDAGVVLRPAIIHSDQRSAAEVCEIHKILGPVEIERTTGNPLFPGFMLASLYWVIRREPETSRRIRHVLAPKDFLRYRMTGAIGADHSDASATGAYDWQHHGWADDMLARLGLNPGWMPSLHDAAEIAGALLPDVAANTGLPAGLPVVFGGADQPMQALGNGVMLPGEAIVTIGSGGQVFFPTANLHPDPAGRFFAFQGLRTDLSYAQASIMNAGTSLEWLNEKILRYPDFKALDAEAARVPAWSRGLLYFPYLTGERVREGEASPAGAFWGLSLLTDRASMARAAMEGVAFALRNKLERLTGGHVPKRLILSGGGAASALWRQIAADVFQRDVYLSKQTEQAGVGAAMAAGVGTGVFVSLEDACDRVACISGEPTRPDVQLASSGEERYRRFLSLTETGKPAHP